MRGGEPANRSNSAEDLAAALSLRRVGGAFWGAPAVVQTGCSVIVAAPDASRLVDLAARWPECEVAALVPARCPLPDGMHRIDPGCDPWSLCETGLPVVADAGEELLLVAALAGREAEAVGGGRFAACGRGPDGLAETLEREFLAGEGWRCPLTGAPMDILALIEQFAHWRALLESNRDVAEIHGIARWKRATLDALLWDGTGPVRHGRQRAFREGSTRALAWKSRTRPAVLNDLSARGLAIGEVEDGMIRSSGLGADCVPPLSAIVDRRGIYFDPSVPSDLEHLLETAVMPSPLLERARALRETLVGKGIGKYGRHEAPVFRQADGRRRVLLCGQVADDRSMLTGGKDCTNLDLMIRARELEPDAWIIYKPHPDVEAGHRQGHVPDAQAINHVDEIERSAPIAGLLDSVDAVHVITSLAGFEALLRGRPVTTHGTPFYAGWGLTRDLRPIPARRTRVLTLDELVAGTLLLYPRYVDPVSGLPCPAEITVSRIAAGRTGPITPLTRLRRLQGRLRQWARPREARA